MDDNQQMGQMPVAAPAPVVPASAPEPVMTEMPSPKGGSGVGYAIAVVAIVALAAAGFWYYFSVMQAPAAVEAPLAETPAPEPVAAPVVDPTQLSALTAGNTTADIAADLSQLPDTAAALEAAAAAASNTVSGF